MAAAYKALAAAAVSRGAVELPDGQTYTVAALSVADMLTAEAMRESGASDDVAVPVFAAIVVRVTGAPLSVVNTLPPEEIANLINMARYGVDLVSAALAAEAPAEGNAPAGTKPRRSTSRSAR